MTPIEKAEGALNRRIEHLQHQLHETKAESGRSYLVQAIVVSIAIGEAISQYVGAIGHFAKARHAGLKQTQLTMTEEHATLLKHGHVLLEQLKASPSDRELRNEIERAQRRMAVIQKTLRRGADTLQREVSPSMGLIDTLSGSVRRLCDAEDRAGLKRSIKMVVGEVQSLYRVHPTLPSKGIIDGEAWETAAVAAIDGATDFYDAYARAGIQALLAIDVITMAISESAPQNADEATQRANTSVAQRLRTITERFRGV